MLNRTNTVKISQYTDDGHFCSAEDGREFSIKNLMNAHALGIIKIEGEHSFEIVDSKWGSYETDGVTILRIKEPKEGYTRKYTKV